MTSNSEEMFMNFLNRVEGKIDKATDDISDLKVTVARLTETVIIHEKRSTNLEKIVENCRNKCDERFDVVEKAADDAKDSASLFRAFFRWTGWILTGLISATGVVIAILELISKRK